MMRLRVLIDNCEKELWDSLEDDDYFWDEITERKTALEKELANLVSRAEQERAPYLKNSSVKKIERIGNIRI